jgi:hypothetical protein
MDCIQWARTSLFIDPKNEKENEIDVILDDLYHNYSVYRTIIFCRNNFSMRECSKSLYKLNLQTIQSQTIWNLQTFHSSSCRIILIPFDLLYKYNTTIFKLIIKQNYLVIFNDLLSLQEQFCLDMLKIYTPALNYYIYIN